MSNYYNLSETTLKSQLLIMHKSLLFITSMLLNLKSSTYLKKDNCVSLTALLVQLNAAQDFTMVETNNKKFVALHMMLSSLDSIEMTM